MRMALQDAGLEAVKNELVKDERMCGTDLCSASDLGFVAFFSKLSKKSSETRTTRLFDRTDYYSVHGQDAHYVAQNFVETFVDDRSSRRTLQCPLSRASFIFVSQDDYLKLKLDLYRVRERFKKSIASIEDVVACAGISSSPQGTSLWFSVISVQCEHKEHKKLIDEIYTKPFQTVNDDLVKYGEMVGSTLDPEELENHNYAIKPGYDERLQALGDKLVEIRDGLDFEYRATGKDLDLDLDKKLHLENSQNYGYCFRLTKNDAKAIMRNSKYIELGTVKSGVYFTTKKLKALSTDHQETTHEYQRTQSGCPFLRTGTYTPVLENLDHIIAHLDVILSFAHVSVNASEPYVKPKVLDKGKFLRQFQDDISFILNDVEMVKGKVYRTVTVTCPMSCLVGDGEFQNITGPNTGEKSTYIRQVGVIALTAQTGWLVPCSEATLPIFSSVLCRILETASILGSATEDSLIIIDELSRGILRPPSAPSELPHLNNFHVVAYVNQEDASVPRERDITLLYKVEPGVSDQSFGIHVAQLANFPENVVKLAKWKADELEDFVNGQQSEPEHSDEVTEEGIQIIEKLLKKWASESCADDEDVMMDDVSHEAQLAELRRCGEEFRPHVEQNARVQSLLMSFLFLAVYFLAILAVIHIAVCISYIIEPLWIICHHRIFYICVLAFRTTRRTLELEPPSCKSSFPWFHFVLARPWTRSLCRRL
ncbi:DNA mismatch repair protein MutS [Suillus subluteus]|nr:DNA mismatch repair protein MutS [Suillus subluteus]